MNEQKVALMGEDHRLMKQIALVGGQIDASVNLQKNLTFLLEEMKSRQLEIREQLDLLNCYMHERE